MNPKFLIVDLFCGAGGTTTGYEHAMQVGLDGKLHKVAKVIACVNHDPIAIKSHWENHPEVKHFTEDIRTLDLTELVKVVRYWQAKYPDAKLILWASLECTNFSKAKGGQPRDADSRTLADHLHRYIEALKPDYIKIENVVEFMSWGPLTGKVIKSKGGYRYCNVRFKAEMKPVLNEDGTPVMMQVKKRGKVVKEVPVEVETSNFYSVWDGVPESKKRGRDYMRWRREICEHGYRDEWRELNAADFGAFTSRNRLFGIFAKPGLPIAWPTATHSKKGSGGMFGSLAPWKPVRDVLDFTDEGESIFGRKKPLVDKTLERIYAGLIKFVAGGKEAFLTKYYSGNPASMVSGLNEPAPTLRTKDGQGLVHASFLSKQFSGDPVSKNIPVDGPAGTVTTVDHHALVNARFLTQYYGNGYNSSLDTAAPTLTTKDRCSLVDACFIVQRNSGFPEHRTISLDGPARTLTTTGGNQELVQPHFMLDYHKTCSNRETDQPAPTLCTKDKHGLVFIDKQYGSGPGNQISVDGPAGTITINDHHALVQLQPFIANYYSGGRQLSSVDEPAGTIMPIPKERVITVVPFLMNPSWFGHSSSVEHPSPVLIARQDKAPLYLVFPETGALAIRVDAGDSEIMIRIKEFMVLYGIVDIKMRMLKVPELLRIQGFPEGYKLAGTQTDQKRFIGNSVERHVVTAWCLAMAGAEIIRLLFEAA